MANACDGVRVRVKLQLKLKLKLKSCPAFGVRLLELAATSARICANENRHFAFEFQLVCCYFNLRLPSLELDARILLLFAVVAGSRAHDGQADRNQIASLGR